MSGNERSPTTLYVSNFKSQIVEGDLEELFQDYGDVVGCKIWRDRYTAESKRFGFVTLSSRDAAEAAIEALNGIFWGRLRLTVRLARSEQ